MTNNDGTLKQQVHKNKHYVQHRIKLIVGKNPLD